MCSSLINVVVIVFGLPYAEDHWDSYAIRQRSRTGCVQDMLPFTERWPRE
jgi:hypothetical protein